MSTITVHLSKDPIMKELIEKHGGLDMDYEVGDIYSNIVREIISQQLSGKAAETIFSRFKSLLANTDPFSPEEILLVDDEIIRYKAGVSYAKIKYIKGLSSAVINKDIDLEEIHNLNDEDAIEKLTSIKGIGPWTAEMLLMFTYKRPDIFSIGDVGLRNAVSKLFNVDRDDNDSIITISKKWKPYRSYASRYLWKSLN